MKTSFSLVAELEKLAGALAADDGDAPKISLNSVAERIAKALNVKADEVAILGLSTRWKHLHFLAPEALQHVGYIPLSSNSALAARTARESRPEINNNFAAVRHASVFEGVKVPGSSTEAIQKIISAPILHDGKVVGIIQISRKGTNPATAGADFTAAELGQVLALCKPLGKLLRHVAGNKQ
jgi:GAF domain-containing protein